MNNHAVWKWIGIAGVATSGAWLRVPYVVHVLLWVMGIDVFTGILAAFVTKELSSRIMVRGLVGKIAVFPLLALLHIIETPLGFDFQFETLTAIAFIVYESMSILENCARAGVPIPMVIVSALAKAKIPTATEGDIEREFSRGDSTTTSVEKTTATIVSAGPAPDLKIDKTITTIEEKHVETIDPRKT